MTHTNPIFLFSLPRSGSTLLQRIMAAHESVATLPEPWFLLPTLYATRSVGVYSEYRHELAALATREFARSLPGGMETYLDSVRAFALDLYSKAASGAPYFLDKTPRYHLIGSEIMDLFPEAKFVFLWRNPLAIAASIITSWGGGNWNLFHNDVDLKRGLPSLIDLARSARDVLQVRYEELVEDPVTVTGRIWAYLGLDPELVAGELPTIGGLMGDKKQASSQQVNTASLHGWAAIYNTPLRRRWAREYLRTLGDDRLSYMGYSTDELLGSLNAASTNVAQVLRDVPRLAYGTAYLGFERLIRKRNVRHTKAALGSGQPVEGPKPP